MSAGRSWFKEFYVGFLLLMLTFLYLSHLNLDQVNTRIENKADGEVSDSLVPAEFLEAEDFIVAT